MLKKRSSDFATLVWETAATVGRNAPKIAHELIRRAFPRTAAEAEIEGADKALRIGVISEIKRVLRHGSDTAEQWDFGVIAPEFRSIVSKLKSKTYFVESAEEYVAVPRLIECPELLDEARRHMRRKGEECLAEATRLDELYAAVVPRPIYDEPPFDRDSATPF